MGYPYVYFCVRLLGAAFIFKGEETFLAYFVLRFSLCCLDKFARIVSAVWLPLRTDSALVISHRQALHDAGGEIGGPGNAARIAIVIVLRGACVLSQVDYSKLKV